jgi:integrase
MKRMSEHALRWGYLKSKPAELVDRPRLAKPKVEILEPDEIARLLDKAEGPYQLAFKACILTGLRAGEFWGL